MCPERQNIPAMPAADGQAFPVLRSVLDPVKSVSHAQVYVNVGNTRESHLYPTCLPGDDGKST